MMQEITFEELLALVDGRIHEQVTELAQSDPTDEGLVLFENLDMSSSDFGHRSVLVAGPNRQTLKSIEQAEGQRLGDVPSRFQYATKFWRKPKAEGQGLLPNDGYADGGEPYTDEELGQ